MFMYSSDRKIIIYGLLGVCVFFLILDVTNVLMGETTTAYFWGLPVGILCGVVTCLSISEKWDPVHLRPKGAKHSYANTRWQWSIPLGVLAANILLNFFDNFIADLIVGVLGGWLYITLGYIAFQVWRHSPR